MPSSSLLLRLTITLFLSASIRLCQAQTPSDSVPPNADRAVSWKLLPSNILADQKQIWTLPLRLVKGKDWVATAAVAGTTAALFGADPSEAAYFRRTQSFHRFNNIFNGNATEIATILTPASLYVIGLTRKDSKMTRTALLAGEAGVDTEILTSILKAGTKRLRPGDIPIGGNYSDTFYDRRGPIWRTTGSFPSGHTIAAFAVATVIARRYSNHRWVPYAAYGLAGLVGFSRLTLSAHFLSDVFAGAALGYTITRFTVLPQTF